MIHEVQLGRKCDTLRHQLEKEVALGANALVKADSLINAQKRQNELRDQALEVQTQRILNQQKANQELKQEVRKHKTITYIASGVAIGTVIAGPVGGAVGFVAGLIISKFK